MVSAIAGVFLFDFFLATPAAAGIFPEIEYHITTESDGTKYKVITAVDGRPLIDEEGNPAPIREPEVSVQIVESNCDVGDPVHVRHGIWALPKNTCYSYAGTRAVAISGVDWLHGGKWNGSVYYQTATACIVRPFIASQRLKLSNGTLCVLSISH